LRPSRTSAEVFLRRVWRQRGLATLLLPVAFLFQSLVGIRRALYGTRLLESHRLPVPVVVIGNITTGGAGKTPLILHLAQSLAAMGCRPGIVSRGYGARRGDAREVHAESTPEEVGDEALLVKLRAGVPVFVGHRRADAGRALLAAYPDCDLLLCDDGLQHYALERDVEIAVIDRRGFMNGWMLPAGPLREPLSRLASVDACVLNQSSVAILADVPMFRMRLAGSRLYLLVDPGRQCEARDLTKLRLHAFAGIGEPQRFFDHLSGLGLRFEPHSFADHYDYQLEDFVVDGDAILMTEKDAVKCARYRQLSIPIWVLPVDAAVDPDIARFILEKLDGFASA
jgi:tetraacyldisaccharide 4'-kinase